MDILYILGTASKWQDNEIRYSLRSIEKYMTDLRNVFVVGERPDFLQNVIHIPYPDRFPTRWKNSYTKTLEACKHPDLSEEFLFMNDDFFMTTPFAGADWPFYHKGSLGISTIGGRKTTSSRGRNTFTILQSLKKPTANFQVHCPLRYEKEKYLAMPLATTETGTISPRSLYCNFYEKRGTLTKEYFLFGTGGFGSMRAMALRAPWFSTLNSTVIKPDFLKLINELYPEPSRFELTS